MNEHIETAVAEATFDESAKIESLIILKQLPVIEETLKTISEEIDLRTAYALSLDCTVETVKEIKKIRAELNKEFETLEKERKRIKNAITSTYDKFESGPYKTHVADKYKTTDSILKQHIDEVEGSVKQKKDDEIRSWFEEYAASKDIAWLKYERAGINVTLSASEKNLKEQAQKFIDRISSDIELIKHNSTPEDREELIVEYKKTLDVLAASRTVRERHELIEAEKARAAENASKQQAIEEAIEKVEQFVPPVEAPTVDEKADEPQKQAEAEKVYSMKFAVTGTMAQLKALKQFLTEGGFKYGSVN